MVGCDFAVLSGLFMQPILVTERLAQSACEFSICTCVTRMDEYDEMKASFERRGFDSSNAEFLFVDNSQGNTFDLYQAINLFIRASRGQFIIICHQDVLLTHDGVDELRRCLLELEQLDPSWAVAGNAGVTKRGVTAIRLTCPRQADNNTGHFPCCVSGLDENFLVLKASANLAASYDLAGFHLYGTDLPLIASVLGYQTYVINFHLTHKSLGNSEDTGPWSFKNTKLKLIDKYGRAFRNRFISTPTTSLFISNNAWLSRFLNRFKRFRQFLARL